MQVTSILLEVELTEKVPQVLFAIEVILVVNVGKIVQVLLVLPDPQICGHLQRVSFNARAC